MLFDHNPLAMGIIAVGDRRYQRCNAAAERLFGYPAGEMVGLPAGSLLAPEAASKLADVLASSAHDYVPMGTLPMRTRDGRHLWCDVGFQRVSYRGEPALLVTAVDATRRVEAERALARSERMFRDGFEQASVPTALLDDQGRFTRANAACARLLGTEAATLTGTPLADWLAPESRTFLDALASAEATDAPSPPRDVVFRRFDGQLAWTEANVVPLGDGADRASRAFLLEIVDRTAMHQATVALHASESRLQLAMDAAADGIWDWNVATGEMYMSAAWSRMLGFEPGELEPHIRTWERLTHPDDLSRAYAALERHAAGETDHVEIELRMLSKQGMWLWVLGRGRIVARDTAGAPTRIVGTQSDIHDLKTTSEALAAQAILLDTILSNIPVALDIIGVTGRFEYVNKHLETLLGWSLEELQDPAVLSRIFPDPAYRELVQRSIREANPAPQDWRMRSRDGRELTMSWSNVRLPDGRVIGIGIDVTAARAAAAAEARLAEQMRQTQQLESLGLLAGGIAHDFNNLLVGVLGNASLAEEILEAGSEARDLVREIRQAASRAADLTRQLLAYAGRGRFVVEPIDLSTLVREMGALMRAGTARGATLRLELASGLPPVEADATQIRQVVMNLITNACDALPGGNGDITVRTGVLDGPHQLPPLVDETPLADLPYVFLEVTDTGVGMSAETRARIFEPFFTTKETGHGLGLAATIGIVHSHRGGIAVRSAPGAGTTIALFLPASSARGRPSPAPSGGIALQGSGTVLLADDEPTVLAVAQRALQRAGYTVVAVADGAEAFRRFNEAPDAFAAVVLDLTMPGLGGQEALRLMRERRKDLPAVLCSGYTNVELDRALTDDGSIEFLQKPFTGTRLIAAVTHLLATP